MSSALLNQRVGLSDHRDLPLCDLCLRVVVIRPLCGRIAVLDPRHRQRSGGGRRPGCGGGGAGGRLRGRRPRCLSLSIRGRMQPRHHAGLRHWRRGCLAAVRNCCGFLPLRDPGRCVVEVEAAVVAAPHPLPRRWQWSCYLRHTRLQSRTGMRGRTRRLGGEAIPIRVLCSPFMSVAADVPLRRPRAAQQAVPVAVSLLEPRLLVLRTTVHGNLHRHERLPCLCLGLLCLRSTFVAGEAIVLRTGLALQVPRAR
mmetsp:Transcript_6752/g.18615  ORF Transcript_6752/g.18615 Transcript_6752/m.18615 type:complete len:254 (+) Transcript_6752:291-1052(+)